MNKRLISSLLVVAILLTMSLGVLAASPKIDWLVEKGFVEGDGQGDLKLDSSLTREEAAVLIVKGLAKEKMAPAYQGLSSKFKDMGPKVWSNGMVNVASETSIINGYPNGNFGPKDKLTYEQMIVMLVQLKGGLSESEKASGPWPAPYITKAGELGILDGVTIKKSSDLISRKDAFELLYNAIYEDVNKEENKDLASYKALVTEVERVHPIGDKELGIVILEKGQNASYENKEYTRINFDKLPNPEGLLGKVLDLKLDKNNKLVSYDLDLDYSYDLGPVSIDKGLRINGEDLDIRETDSAKNVSDKLQFAYFNDKKVSLSELKSLKPNFARVTSKNGRVIGIESFKINDIRIIDSVKENRIYFTDGTSQVIDKPILVKDQNLGQFNMEDIQRLDLAHFFGPGQVLISKDVDLKGKLDNTISKDKEIFVEIDGRKILLSKDFPLEYTKDGKNFISLTSDKAYKDLYNLRGKEVTYGINLLNNLAYIESRLVYNEGFQVIENITTREVSLLDGDGKTSKVSYNLDLNLLDLDGRRKDPKDLRPGDLIYLLNQGEKNETLVFVNSLNNILKSSKSLDKDSKSNFVLGKNEELSPDYKAFLVIEDKGKLVDLKAEDLDKIFSLADKDSNLKAYKITDKDFDDLKLSEKISSGSRNVINTIIITGFERGVQGTKEVAGELKYDFKPDYHKDLVLLDPEISYDLAKNVSLEEMKAGDYVKIYLNSDDEIVRADLIFTSKSPVYEVVDFDLSKGKIISISLKDGKTTKDYYTSNSLEEIGRIDKGSKVKVNINKNGDIDIILEV